MKLRQFIYAFLILGFVLSASLSIYFFLKAFHYKAALTSSAPPPSAKYHFILIPEEVGNPYWQMVKNGADQAGKEANAAIEYAGPVQTNITEHIQYIDQAIASKVDGIITQGLNPAQMTSVINKAVEHGIPVITIDTDAPNSQRAAYVGTNNYQAGYNAGKALIKATNGNANVAIIVGSFVSANQQKRVQGFKAALKEQKGIHIVDIQSSNISRVQAAQKTYDIYKKHPNVNAFFGTSALDGLGIAAATAAYKQSNKPFIIGFDTLPETLKAIKNGTINETVAQEPYYMGYESVKLMVDLLNGKQISKINYTDTMIITQKNLPPLNQSTNYGGLTP